MVSKKKSAQAETKKSTKGGPSVFAEYAKAIILAIILAMFVRTFILQAFHIPSGSMIPTFLEGDRVLVTKFAYGVRNPFTNNPIFETWRPERGDVVVFIYPEEPDKDYVKRVIGLPGETVALQNKVLYINGVETPDPWAKYYPNVPAEDHSFGPVTVPEGQYFMMGDNRDNSRDSRRWGFVDYSLLRGKAWRIYWSWDSQAADFSDRLRGSRLGQKIE